MNRKGTDILKRSAIARSFRLARLHPPQVLALGFLVIIFIGAFLLNSPIALQQDGELPFIDALFMATSATCVTGLSVVNSGLDFTLFGQLVLLTLVQLGGLGFMTMATLIALAFKRRITFKERLILQEAMNHGSVEGIVRLIRRVLLYSLVIEAVGALLLTGRFLLEMPADQAIYFGLFHSISIFNNAGFDLFGMLPGRPGSLIHYVNDPFVNVVTMLLIFLGGIGFIVIDDLLHYRKRRKLTLHSKVVLSVSLALIALGALVILVFEYTNPLTLQKLGEPGKLLSSLFQSVSMRSAGVSTLDVASMRQATQFFTILMMFIGAAPGSSGGGIKVTTFAILVGAVIAMLRGRQDIVMFKRRLPQDRVYKAITFTLFSFFFIILAAMILSVTESYNFLGILFEATSAYATAGLSMGLTAELSIPGKILLMVLMFVGRLGPVTLAFALTPKHEKELYRYPEGKITIG
ncbi:TrkH family potassium uptake protein [Gorillibacterium sp. CAU 1737]|uniref:TrkH family potassium uptake protein n=1 Tax=Gorillibacterium sp. CAU 1737 TaxID=3140362 RepID=UPI003260208B